MRRALSFAFACLLIAAGGPCGAQEVIATAKNTPPPAPPMSAAPLWLGHHADFDDEGPPRIGPCGAVGEVHDGVAEPPDKKVHGEVFGGVGTRGYREIGGVLCVPVGDHAAVTVAIDAGRIGR